MTEPSSKTVTKKAQRPTEPLPKTIMPLLKLIAFLAFVTVALAAVSWLIDRMIYA